MYFAEEVVSKRTLTKNQSDTLWILADGKGHSNRAISKQLKSKWSEVGNKRLNESNCLRDVIKPLMSNKMIFSQKRKGEKTSTGIHDEEAYYIRQSALKHVYTVLKDVWNTKHERSLHWYDAYIKKELQPDLDNKVEEALNKLYLLEGLEKEIDEYEHSLQFIKDRAPNLNVLSPTESGYRNGCLPPNEIYFILGKDIQHECLSLTYP
jgi:hypothetical protein